MKYQCIFIYDGECPFCNHFAQLLDLKKSIPLLKIMDGRQNLAQLEKLYKQGYDLNEGGILLTNGNIMQGSEAITWICTQIKDPNEPLLEILRLIFTSNKRSKILFPVLLWTRRLSLTLKGKLWQPVSVNKEIF